MRDRLNKIIAIHTGQTIDKVAKDTDRDFFMTPGEAKDYGIVDEVFAPKKLVAVAATEAGK
jgi:ATP-dependent Clp protease protease subunit